MSPETWGMIAAILIPLGMMVLRALTRERPNHADPEGVSVFAGDEATCRSRVDLLADAGVTAWLDRADDAWEVHVDVAQAQQVPELLRRRDEAPVEDGPKHPPGMPEPPLA